MSLKGSLQTIALPEVLQLLSTTGKTGALHVVGDAGEGRLWFTDGRLTAFSVGSAQVPSEAIFQLLRVPDGDFSLVVDEERTSDAVRVEGGADVASALLAAEECLAEWQEITQVVPSLDHHLMLAPEASEDVIAIDQSQWRLVVAVGDGRSVREVLHRASLSEFEGCRAVRGSVLEGLIVVHEPVRAEVEPLTALSVVADDEPCEESSVDVVDFDVDEVTAHEVEDHAVEDHAVEPEVDYHEVEDHAVEPEVDYHEVEDHAVESEVVYPDSAVDSLVGVDSLPGSILRFGVDTPSVAADDSTFEVETEADLAHVEPEAADFDSAKATGEDLSGDGSESDDRYAALRAAMLEVNEAEPEGDGYDAETGDGAQSYATASVAQQYEIGTEPDGRAALEALLSEVREEEAAYQAGTAWPGYDEATPVPAYEPIDGLADRGPWTEHELASMDSQSWVQPAGSEGTGEVVTFGEPAAEVSELNSEPADGAPQTETSQEDPAPAEEPMNRGLLLKFLSSVRN